MTQEHEKILIIGAGFAGISAAKELARRSKALDITLLDKNPYTTMLPALPDLAAKIFAEEDLKGDINILLPDNVTFIQDTVKSISLDDRTVITKRSGYDYDFIITACGSVTNFFGFDRNIEHIHTVDSLQSVIKIRNAFDEYLQNTSSPVLVISGAGYTGLETAASFRYYAEKTGCDLKVKIIELSDKILPFLTEKEQQYIKNILTAHGIEILTGTSVDGFDGKNMTLSDSQVIEDAFFVWTAGTKHSIDDIDGDIQRINDGRIIVDNNLNIPGYPNAFAAGDSAAISDGSSYLRKSVNFAIQTGIHSAGNILKQVGGKKMTPYKPSDPGWVIPVQWGSVGRAFEKFRLKGKMGLRLHYFMCGYRNYSLRNFLTFLKKSLSL